MCRSAFFDSEATSSKSVRPLTTSTARCGFLGRDRGLVASGKRKDVKQRILIDGSTYFDLIFSRFGLFSKRPEQDWDRLIMQYCTKPLLFSVHSEDLCDT